MFILSRIRCNVILSTDGRLVHCQQTVDVIIHLIVHLSTFAFTSLKVTNTFRIRKLASPESRQLPDYYKWLSIPHDASPSDIKAAYHRALLHRHPDKLRDRKAARPYGERRDTGHDGAAGGDDKESALSVGEIKEAYLTLSTPHLREEHDSSLRNFGGSVSSGPRPAQIISLDDFDAVQGDGDRDGDVETWHHRCRCGGRYIITYEQLEQGQHLVGCNSCSEVIWAGYEIHGSQDEAD